MYIDSLEIERGHTILLPIIKIQVHVFYLNFLTGPFPGHFQFTLKFVFFYIFSLQNSESIC